MPYLDIPVISVLTVHTCLSVFFCLCLSLSVFVCLCLSLSAFWTRQDAIDEGDEEDLEEGSSDDEGSYDGASDDGASDDGASIATAMSALSIRSKNETAEEKRARKAAVKAAKREARANKKLLKMAFKQEGKRLDKAKARNAANMDGKSRFSYSAQTGSGR